MVGIKHIQVTSFHPQTNGKVERYHQTLKLDVNQVTYELPTELEAAIAPFVGYYNYRRYHKAMGQRDTIRCPQRKEREDPATQKGGANTNDRTAKTLQ